MVPLTSLTNGLGQGVCADFVKSLIHDFGHMNKNDYEVAIFHFLLENGFDANSDFEISRQLKISEAKVKRHRYESNLIYGQNKDESFFRNQFYELLQTSIIKISKDDKIQFAINDKMLRLYLHDKLAKHGSFADSSFNSNIVSITQGDLIILIADFEGKKELLIEIENQIKKSGEFNPKKLPKELKDKILGLIKYVGKILLNVLSNWLLNWLNNNIL